MLIGINGGYFPVICRVCLLSRRSFALLISTPGEWKLGRALSVPLSASNHLNLEVKNSNFVSLTSEKINF